MITFINNITNYKGKQTLVKVNRIVPPAPKPLSEIKGIIIDKYQEYLDKKWVAELKSRYPVEINWDVFNTLLSVK